VPNDVLGTRPALRSVLNELLHLIIVGQSDSLREGEIRSNVKRNAKLIKLQVWIGSNDGSRRKVYSLPHQVASEPTFLALESRSYGFQLLARLVLLLWLAADIVVHESSSEELELCQDLVDGALVGSFLDLALEDVVHLDDLLVGVSQIILTPVHIWHGDRWSDWWRSHSKIFDDHPLWPSMVFVEAHELEIFISDLPEDLEAFIRVQNLLSILGLIKVFIEVLDFDGEPLLCQLWLLVATASSLRIADSSFLRTRS